MESTGSSLEIDIVIPTAYKDIRVLPLCIRGIRECIEDSVKDIYVISADNDEIRKICDDNDCIFIDEVMLMGFSPSDMVGIREDKRGWLYQQLIKLRGDIGTCENYLVIDSDVVLLRPYRFIDGNGVPSFIKIPYTYKEYGDVNFKLTGISKKVKEGFIADKMLFNKGVINEIHQVIENHCGKGWIDAIMDEYNNDFAYGFSEFELYALVYGDRLYNEMRVYELPMHFKDEYTYEICKQKFGHFHCVTFHHYL